MVVARLRALSEPAQGLVAAAAVLGRSCPLATAAALAGSPTRSPPSTKQSRRACWQKTGVARIPLSPSPIRWSTRPSATTSDRPGATGCTGPRPRWFPAPPPCTTGWPPPSGRTTPGRDLEEAAREAATAGTAAQAAVWLAQASAASTARAGRSAGCSTLWRASGQRRRRRGRGLVAAGRPVRPERPAQRLARPSGSALRTGGGRGGSSAGSLAGPRPGHRTAGGSGRGHLAGRLSVHVAPGRGSAGLGRAGRRRQRRASGCALQAEIMVALSLTLAGRGPEGLARLDGLAPCRRRGTARAY